MRRGLAWLLVSLALVVVAVGAVLANLPVPAVISSAAAAVGAIAAGVLTTRAAVVMKDLDDRRQAHGALLRCDSRGGLPLVRDLDDPVTLGVHPAASGDSLPRVPEFVPRDVMPLLRSAMTEDRFVLLVGESTAGKSRAAYEAVRELYPNHQLVEPVTRDGANAAVAAVVGSPRAVLWLDDVERYLGEGGLTGAGISRVLSLKRHRVVATMRAEEYSYFRGSSDAVDGTRSRETVRQGWDVLRLATRIDLPRSWSAGELAEARHWKRRDPRIAEALAYADRFGVAEYLAAGPQLLEAWRDAWAPGTHPRAAALVFAAVDARRSGMHRPLSAAMLIRAHHSYLDRRGGHLLRPEPVDDAIEWATTPWHATSSLLIPGDDGTLIAFDYLIDAIERVSIPAGALEAFVDAGHQSELRDIGEAAWHWDRPDQAERAFAKASVTHAIARSDRGYVIGGRDGRAAQERFLRRSIEELASTLGDEHADTLDAKVSLAWYLGRGRSPRISLRRLAELRREAERALGAFHPIVLNIRRGMAMRFGEVGELRQSARMFQRLLEDCVDHLDESEWVTYGAIFGYIEAVGHASTRRYALELFDDFDIWMRERRAPARYRRVLRYECARQLNDDQQYEAAAKAFAVLVAEEERAHGRLNTVALNARCEWLRCLSASGDGARALRIARDLLNEYQTSAEASHIDTWQLRYTMSTICGEMGDTTMAARILDELRETKALQLGEDDPLVQQIDNRLRFWAAVDKARDGHQSEALEELRALGEDLLVWYGVHADLRKSVLREMGKLAP